MNDSPPAQRSPQPGVITMYATGFCPYCIQAERLLKAKGVREIAKIRVDLEPALRQIMMDMTGRRTVPQIYIGETHVGGYDDLVALDRAGRLDALLSPIVKG
jgi:glutaredoxin 3